MPKNYEKHSKKHETELFLEKLNEDYARLKEDSHAWKKFQDEMSEWDITNKDGLDLD